MRPLDAMLGKGGSFLGPPSGVQIDGLGRLEAQRLRYDYFNDYYFESIIIALFENILPFLTKLTERLLGANSLESLVVLVLWLTN